MYISNGIMETCPRTLYKLWSFEKDVNNSLETRESVVAKEIVDIILGYFSILPQTYVSSRKLRVLTQKSHLKVRGKFEDT